ncbi:hypothetical protein GG804_26275 [Sphingomonas histidinilytica]|uniref:hypothetical protein n=1 Tax=Rhizorhabdus histidinilytica TaxID=439228 RepID=UPI001ADA04E3|nr:hypothetical protein [Rhizorhabdus histidinilytica]MBO9380276.1 hypothetical protein [Rhizorhabdus histidinilytica]
MMTSAQLKALRRRQAKAASERAARTLRRYELLAAEADELGLLNEAIFYANKVSYWKERIAIVSDPKFHAMRAGERRDRERSKG